jgi:hypothetical protein
VPSQYEREGGGGGRRGVTLQKRSKTAQPRKGKGTTGEAPRSRASQALGIG